MNIDYSTTQYKGRFTTVTQAAKTLGISRTAAYTMIKDGTLVRTDSGIPVDQVNFLRKARIKAAFEEYERLVSIPEL